MHSGKGSKKANDFRKFFEGVFSTLFKNLHLIFFFFFIIIRKASRNCFEGCTHDYVQIQHPRKCSKQGESFKVFFKNSLKMII